MKIGIGRLAWGDGRIHKLFEMETCWKILTGQVTSSALCFKVHSAVERMDSEVARMEEKGD